MAHENAASNAVTETTTGGQPYIHALFVGQPKTITDERGTWTSSIYRDQVHGPVQA